ncbi:MAG: N-6 DNA methylase [Syntrophales bacterium]
MLDADTKAKIDSARDILVGKVPDPKSQVEQITIALIYKFMDDMDRQSEELGGKATFFAGEFKKYRWAQLLDKQYSGHERLLLYAEGIEKMNENKNIPQLFRDIFKGVFLPYRDPETLNLFLKEINGFTYDHSEQLGNAFEYLLSVLGSQGEAGQFRTPRHIIDFIVSAIDPRKDETILDPACGTAGFLVASFKYIMTENATDRPGDRLSADERERLMSNFCGYDISPDMVRLSRVNMYLHGFANPRINEYDTLTSEDRWEDRFDVIFANPPFMTPKGGIRPHNRFSIKSRRSELLFADYIVEHLRPGGKAGFIVPEGILFVEQGAYVKFRRNIVENNFLYAVVSLPHGVFKPYASVKTHILLLDRRIASQCDRILFVDIESDGFSQTDTRLAVERDDIPHAMRVLSKYRKNPQANPISSNNIDRLPEKYFVPKAEILKNPTCVLIGRWYNLASKYPKYPPVPFKRLGDLCDLRPGLSPNMKTLPGEYPLVTPAEDRKTADHFDLEGPAVCVPLVSSSGHGKADIKRLHYQEGMFALATTMVSVSPKADAELLPRYLFQVLSERKDDLIAPLMAGATNVTLKQDLFENILIPVPSTEIQKEIIDHAAWELLAVEARTLRAQVAQGIDGERADEIVGLLDQATSLLHRHAAKKREVKDLWREDSAK